MSVLLSTISSSAVSFSSVRGGWTGGAAVMALLPATPTASSIAIKPPVGESRLVDGWESAVIYLLTCGPAWCRPTEHWHHRSWGGLWLRALQHRQASRGTWRWRGQAKNEVKRVSHTPRPHLLGDDVALVLCGVGPDLMPPLLPRVVQLLEGLDAVTHHQKRGSRPPGGPMSQTFNSHSSTDGGENGGGSGTSIAAGSRTSTLTA